MSFDKETRKLLAKTVTVCRRKLIEDVTDQLRGLYGLHPDGTVLQLDKLTHLSPDQIATARRLRSLLDHYTAGAAGKESDRRKEAYERMVLEISFTVLNRLAALRLCEERGLVIECVRKGTASDGFLMFERISGGALGGRYDTYRVFLECLFDELALDLGVLFDRMTPQSAVFPTERCLEDVLTELNKDELTPLWTEDETIGWIYQYFNPKEERDAMRKASRSPRNTRELAVRNQFFTPRYVVEFLTDNTLGRIWYEMRKGDTVLKDVCRYLVRRPNEIFLAPGEKTPISRENEADLSQEELLKQSVYIEHRLKKDPRNLRVLDPACGSGHFLLYAFDLLEHIYEEAWCDPECAPTLWSALNYCPSVDITISNDFADIESVMLKRDAQASCFRCGGHGDRVVLGDLYQTPWPAGRPLIYCSTCESEVGEAVRCSTPLEHFSYAEVVKAGWFANSTGTTFLEIADCFDYSKGGPNEGMFEMLSQASQDENLMRLRLAVPKLIIEHNLHGIDIDPRAVQIAALALWLRAQKTWKSLGIKAAARPQITKSNLVTAEPMPGEEDMRSEFTANLKPRVLGQLVDVVFEKMKLAGEAGSLLNIEEDIKDAVAEARKQWLDGPKPEQTVLFPELVKPKPEQQQLRFDLTGVTNEQFWVQAEEHILDALKDYAERAENRHAVRRRLFAEDAARGFAFIDICTNRYDAILMNPPFGAASRDSKDYIEVRYPKTKGDVLANFIERTLQLVNEHGRVGAISSRTPFFLGSFEDLRTEVLGKCGHVRLMADLGEGVLEAMVETAVYVLTRHRLGEPESLFFRLLIEKEKGEVLQQLIDECLDAYVSDKTFIVNPKNFESLNANPYVYWVSKQTIDDIGVHPRIEGNKGTIRVGLQTSDDFRFLRLLWEVMPNMTILGMAQEGMDQNIARRCLDALSNGKSWTPYSKTDIATPWYSPITLVVNWAYGGVEIKAFAIMKGNSPSRNVRSESEYFLPGFSYMLRSTRLVPYLVPAGVIPTAGRAQIFPKFGQEYTVLGICASNVGSAVARFSGEKFAWPKFQASMVQGLPACDFTEDTLRSIKERVDTEVNKRRFVVQHYEPFQEFTLPAWIRSADEGQTTWDLYSLFGRRLENDIAEAYGLSSKQLIELERDIREAVSIRGSSDQVELEDTSDDSSDDEQELNIELISETPEEKAVGLFMYAVGVAFGRWDVRIALDPSLAPKLSPPFEPLPICPPGLLVSPDGLPAEPDRIVSEEWLRARPDVNTLPHDGSCNISTISDEDYPLRVSWDGILVDDPGFSGAPPHRDDIVRRVREMFDLLWQSKAQEVEQEACDILGVSDLHDYFRRPSGFFQDHLNRYSKSRRKAPIYWPLSTASGSYTIWLYYHRLTSQTLYTVVNKYVEPKITETDRRIARIEDKMQSASGRGATQLTDKLNEVRAFHGELQDLREELLRIAALPYKPNLNDGAIINAAPLHTLFRLRSWAKDTDDCWTKLTMGEYDWAHLAYTVWPERVQEVCRTDRSIAIAQGLEELCEVEAPVSKKKSAPGRRKKEAAQ